MKSTKFQGKNLLEEDMIIFLIHCPQHQTLIITRKSMLEFDRVNPCFYLKVSYNEEVLSVYYTQ